MIKILHRSIILLFAMTMGACGTSSISLSVMKPADITVSQHIKRIAVVNRSFPSKKTKVENILEGVITGEGIGQDRDGSEECVSGLVDILTRTERFDAIRPAIELEGTGREAFPPPLPWEEVERICAESNADALLLLEVFDSDSKFTHKIVQEKSKTKEGVEVVRDVSEVTTDVKVTTGWRLYDPKNKRIIDEYKTSGGKSWSSRGSSEEDARNRLPSKRNTVRDCGFIAGNFYAQRISPVPVRVTRSYYVRKHPSLKKAKNFVRVNDWNGAAEEWKKVLATGDNKQKGRAAYNMA
ncbi:MAG: hypothetical protein KDD36_11330, partial [Flavobacteriales bacterium]|nr:hypothetical protein [Flavobacteriales bacterium]